MKIYGVLDKSHTREMSWSKKRDLQKQIDVTLDAVEASVSRSHSTKEKSNTTHVQPKHITSSNLDTFINDGIVSISKCNGSQLKKPDISGALFTLRIQYSYTQTQCEDGARAVRVLQQTPVTYFKIWSD